MRTLPCILLLWMLLFQAGNGLAQHQLDFVIPACPHLGLPPEGEQLTMVNIFPNPAATRLTIELSGPGADGPASGPAAGLLAAGVPVPVKVYNVLGMLVLDEEVRFTGRTATLDVSALPGGLYVLQLHTAAGVHSKKIVIRHEP